VIMQPSPPLAVFVDHYASGPSGITTYADHLEAAYPSLWRINLHASSPADSATLARRRAAIDVPPERSHDPHLVADLLVESVTRHPDRRVAWLPNVGEVAWAGAWRALDRLSSADRARVRLLGIVHGDQASQYEAMRRYAPIIAGLAGVSRRCVETLDAQRSASGARPTELLHYPVRLPRDVSCCRAGEPLRLLYAGRFEESQKRVSRLTELFRALAANGIPFTASLAGDGPNRLAVEAQLAALPPEVASRITCLGAVPHDAMPELLRSHDVLLLVSAFEGTPLALLEAMAAGLCPVLMDLPGGLPELLDDGGNACLVPQGDVEAMANAIGVLHHDRQRLATIKAAARSTLEARGGPEAHARWLRARLDALFELPPPQPDKVTDPDPLGRRIDRLVGELTSAATGASASVIAIWGAGVVGRQIADGLLGAGQPPVRMVDSDAVRHGVYRGIRVEHPSSLESHPPDVICVGSIAFAAEIRDTLEQRGMRSKVVAP
jgi:glycosyltransferase involved in cell wall biosynthesis